MTISAGLILKLNIFNVDTQPVKNVKILTFDTKVIKIFTSYLSKTSHPICQNKLKTLKDLSSEVAE